MFERAEIKSVVAEAINSGKYSSFLAISYHFHLPAQLVRELFRELQMEWEIEMNSWLVE